MGEMEKRRIDMGAYARREHFRYFCGMGYPYVGLTHTVDVTAFVKRTKEAGFPFFLTFLWCAAKAANQVPELRQRIEEGEIVEFSACPTSNTVAKPDGTYCYCALYCDKPLAQFIPYAVERQKQSREQGGIHEEGTDSLPMFFISSMPWLSYTALVQPVPSPADSNPRITWGKYERQGERLLMPVSILCHHGLVDGLHIARFYENLEHVLSTCIDESL
ncbi:MAG: CatA-like O-acetyltransferase [Clostridia bacterium]|nr:CatA-like O-acetyltransferase [Clostridia bacterium]